MNELYSVWLITFLISIMLEGFIKPLAPRLKRSYSSYILHFSIISLFYLVIVCLVQRPIFSSLFVLITQTIFVLISNAKYKALKEPLVFSDIVMFSQAFKYPRLYFPFLGWLPIIVVPILNVSAIVLVIYFETAIALNYPLLILFIFIAVIFIYTSALRQVHCLNIAQDIQQQGFIASLVSYDILSRQDKHKKYITATLKNTAMDGTDNKEDKAENLQDVVVIQSESFFDARRLHPAVASHVLNNFDRCCAEACHYGRLHVSAWGANTMRTEFSFLSGIAFEDMGYYRFYPYHYMRHYQVSTLASYLQKKGYHCICIHPHHAEFFGRAGLFPQLGFDEFIDIASFCEEDKYGPYTSDHAVSKKMIDMLKQRQTHSKPCFIFAITMENHGPLHLEKVTADEERKYYSTTVLPRHTHELSVYLRHLKHADEMIGTLMTALKKDSKRDTLLCLYGDHVPSMPTIYAETDFNDNRTDYVIWSSKNNKEGSSALSPDKNNKEDIYVQHLAEKIKNSLTTAIN